MEALESHSRGDNPYFEAVAKANLYICEDRIAGRSSTAAIRMLGSWLVNEFSSGITLSNDEIAAKRTLLGRAKLVLQHGSEAASRLKP